MTSPYFKKKLPDNGVKIDPSTVMSILRIVIELLLQGSTLVVARSYGKVKVKVLGFKS